MGNLNLVTMDFSVTEWAKGTELGCFGAHTLVAENGTLSSIYLVVADVLRHTIQYEMFPLGHYVPRQVTWCVK